MRRARAKLDTRSNEIVIGISPTPSIHARRVARREIDFNNVEMDFTCVVLPPRRAGSTIRNLDYSKTSSGGGMEFAFTDEQDQFRSVVRRFLADKSPPTAVRRLMETADGFDPAVWRQLADDLALTGIHIPEAYGGAGFGPVELGIAMEEQGRALLCAPFFSSCVLAASAISNSAPRIRKSTLLPAIASGRVRAALAVDGVERSLGRRRRRARLRRRAAQAGRSTAANVTSSTAAPRIRWSSSRARRTARAPPGCRSSSSIRAPAA